MIWLESILTKKWQRNLMETVFIQRNSAFPNAQYGNQCFDSDPIYRICKISANSYPIHEDIGPKVCSSGEIKNCAVDIRSLYSCSGKSAPSASLKDFSIEKLHSPKNEFQIGFSSDFDWQKNTSSIQSNLSIVNAYYFLWSKRLYLLNSDQSHHIAAVYRQATAQDRNFSINCRSIEIQDIQHPVDEVNSLVFYSAENYFEDEKFLDNYRNSNIKISCFDTLCNEPQIKLYKFSNLHSDLTFEWAQALSYASDRGFILLPQNLKKWAGKTY
jgi:hypothetical protein